MNKLLKKFFKKEDFIYIEEYVRKIVGLKKNKDKIETLILGSSHIEVGFIPNGSKEYNCGTSSQDLYYSYKLYQYINNKKLKNIIISFSTFSPFNEFIKSPTPYLVTYFKILCGIEYPECSKEILKTLKSTYKQISIKIKKYVRQTEKHYDLEKYNGNFMVWPTKSYQRDEDLMTKYAINDAHRFRALKHTPLIYLSRLCREACKNEQNVYIVVTPIIDELYKELMYPPMRMRFLGKYMPLVKFIQT